MELEYSLDELMAAASVFWEKNKEVKVVAVHGEMGAGKTTFIQALCAVKKVKDVVGSPTFSIINEYEYDCEGTKKVLFHLDLYRLKNENEAKDAGVEEALYSGNICLVEWPEKALGLFPKDTLHVYFRVLDDKTRRIKITDI
jgi:tRNA threonylcarbamoyladenosine biosynthesis protein TsaE